MSDKTGLDDFLNEHSPEDLEGLPRDPVDKPPPKKKPTSQATLLIELAAAAGTILFRTPDHEAYATVTIDRHTETWPVKSRPFRRYLARLFYRATKGAPGSQALQDAIGVLEGHALFGQQVHPVSVRVAEANHHIYIDLANEGWEVIEVGPDGWAMRPAADVPVKFRRAKGMLALPTPRRGGSLGPLRDYLNIEGRDWILFLAWLLMAFRPKGPYPVLALLGEQGSGKSWVARTARELVDPNRASLRSEPRDPRDLIIAATNSWVVSLDNVSRVEDWLSDCLCRLATGGGFTTRELYTDSDETIFDAQRPIVTNGIEDYIVRGDLLDRALIVRVPVIPDDKRRSEAEMVAHFERLRPAILGALLDLVAGTLRALPTVSAPRVYRMADFCFWSLAAEAAGAWDAGEFMVAYGANREAANETALEASIIIPALREMMVARPHWTGTASDLLTELSDRAGETTKSKSWPKTARSLSGHLRRLAPNLRAAGLHVGFERDTASKKRARFITLEQKGNPSSVPSVSSETCGNGASLPDGTDAPDDTDGPLPIVSSVEGGEIEEIDLAD